MSYGTEKTLEAQKMTKHFTATFIGHACVSFTNLEQMRNKPQHYGSQLLV